MERRGESEGGREGGERERRERRERERERERERGRERGSLQQTRAHHFDPKALCASQLSCEPHHQLADGESALRGGGPGSHIGQHLHRRPAAQAPSGSQHRWCLVESQDVRNNIILTRRDVLYTVNRKSRFGGFYTGCHAVQSGRQTVVLVRRGQLKS